MEGSVGLRKTTDVLEFSSTLMEQRTLDARGVLNLKSSPCKYVVVLQRRDCRLRSQRMCGSSRNLTLACLLYLALLSHQLTRTHLHQQGRKHTKRTVMEFANLPPELLKEVRDNLFVFFSSFCSFSQYSSRFTVLSLLAIYPLLQLGF